MQVVKCLDKIPKSCWGKVIEDDILAVSDTSEMDLLYYLDKADTFPLPGQGIKVEVSNDGTGWESENWDDDDSDNYPIFIYYNAITNKNKFVIGEKKRPDLTYSYKYIRPIEAKEEPVIANITFSNVPKGFCASSERTGIGKYTLTLIKTNKS